MNVAHVNTKAREVKGPDVRIFSRRIPFEDGIHKAGSEGLVVASNLRLTLALPDLESRREAWGQKRCWSGTIVAHVKPRRKFGETIECGGTNGQSPPRWVFHVPEEYRNIRDAILVVEHPNYIIEADGKNRVVHAIKSGVIDMVEMFPQTGGDCRFYATDPKHGIPYGAHVIPEFEEGDVRQLLRDDGIVIAPIVRAAADTGVKVPYLDLRSSRFAGEIMMVEAA